MSVQGEKQQDCIRIEGELTVSRAAELKDLLAQSLLHSRPVVIDIEQVTRIDLACLQLFFSACKIAQRDGIKWCVDNMENSVLGRAGASAGFSSICNLDCSALYIGSGAEE